MNKIEKGPAFWKAFGQAAALWAAVAVAGSLLLPGGSMTLPEEPEKMGWTVLRVCACLLYTCPSPRDLSTSRMPSSA